MRILDKSAEFNKKITSKYIYSIIKEKNGLVQKTSLLLFHDKDIFKNIHKNIDDSNIKIVNYRALCNVVVHLNEMFLLYKEFYSKI